MWRERFNNKFPNITQIVVTNGSHEDRDIKQKVENFIDQELKRQRREMVKKMIKWVEENKYTDQSDTEDDSTQWFEVDADDLLKQLEEE